MTAYERIAKNLNFYDDPVGDIRLYKRVLREADNDVELADGFCLSKHGGFTKFQLHRVKYHIEYRKKRYLKYKIACV